MQKVCGHWIDGMTSRSIGRYFALLAVLSLLLSASPSESAAASFNCTKVATTVEKLICSDTELSMLDDTLAAEYKEAYSLSKGNSVLKEEQRQWIAQRNTCRNRECLIGAYWSRLADFPTDRTVPEYINCDPSTGEVDNQRCSTPNSIKVRSAPDQLRTRFCMGISGGEYIMTPCKTELTQYILARSRVVRGDQKFCRALLTSEYMLIDLYIPHTIPVEEVNTSIKFFASDTAIYPYVGFFDINNDGKPEDIGWIKAYSGAGSGCTVERFVELDSMRAHIVDTKLTALLGEHNCRSNYRAFRFQGRTYLETRQTKRLPSYGYFALLNEVFELNGYTRRSVCLFTYSDD